MSRSCQKRDYRGDALAAEPKQLVVGLTVENVFKSVIWPLTLLPVIFDPCLIEVTFRYAAENAALFREAQGCKLLTCLVGDSLLEVGGVNVV